MTDFNKQLQKAVDGFDRDGVAELCDQLILHVRERDDAYPADHAGVVLWLLRGKRHFDLMQKVADTLIQYGQTDPLVRRLYAQSQLDQGNLTAAIGILEDLEKQTALGGADPNPDEHAEVRGLLGRAYKDLYVLAAKPDCLRNRRHLEKAIDYYRGIYTGDSSKVWHGVNCVALIRRADDDDVELTTITDPRRLAESMAGEILDEMKRRRQDGRAETWDYGTAVEACIGLRKHEQALEWLVLYLQSDGTDAFELGSTYRQLIKVWKLRPAAPPGDKILPILKAALIQRQGSQIEIRAQDAVEEKLDQLAKDVTYERVLGRKGFKSLKWLQTCMLRANSVARVESIVGDPIGTAFVVRGGDLKPGLGDELLLLTNAHIIHANDAPFGSALPAEKAVIKFDIWREGESPDFSVQELVWSSPPTWLDVTLFRPTPAIEGLEPIPIADVLPLTEDRQRAYIIGHPQGRKLTFSIHDNYLLDYDDRCLHYRSPTEPGSSGSPVLNDQWELIGLHHTGAHYMPRLHGQDGTYPANEGIRIKAIVSALEHADVG